VVFCEDSSELGEGVERAPLDLVCGGLCGGVDLARADHLLDHAALEGADDAVIAALDEVVLVGVSALGGTLKDARAAEAAGGGERRG
jgi:hypothetical protein